MFRIVSAYVRLVFDSICCIECRSSHRKVIITTFLVLLITGVSAYIIFEDATRRYGELLSTIVYDRAGIPLSTEANAKGLYVHPLRELHNSFSELLIQKEDRFFYYHPGVNPASIVRAVVSTLLGNSSGGASTITEQLSKNLLGTEAERTVPNKLKEIAYAISLELFTTKEEILLMYSNTAFLGNQVQGFETASRAYFGKPLRETTTDEQLTLLATLSHPSTRNPWKEENDGYARALHKNLGLPGEFLPPTVSKSYSLQHPASFEMKSAGISCTRTCQTTIDAELTEELRKILRDRVERERDRGARNGAIVVIDAQNSELIAIVGSPDPSAPRDGGQINMALEPRPIGSTVKPFIYLKGFEIGLRPYSLVDDREYKYPIATGFPLYPKNFDGAYRGEVTLHQALSNSLNVPSVKVLEYIGLDDFYRFLEGTLRFKPVQSLDSYQYGIALGGLEMDLLTLSHFFTLFPRNGTLAPLRVLREVDGPQPALPPQSNIGTQITVSEPKYVELVHAIISDRLTGVDQFGLKSNLNLTIPEYAVKTGTSRDFHDSWVVGYTPDLVVGVWLGNAENEALKQVTGQSGAGAVWHDVMEYIAETSYYRNKTFSRDYIKHIAIGLSEEWGLPEDVVRDHRTLLLDDNIVTSIHPDDTFELTDSMRIPLRSRVPVVWSVNGKELGESKDTSFTPSVVGTYEIRALEPSSEKVEYIQVHVTTPQ